jgi:hypothetical protein
MRAVISPAPDIRRRRSRLSGEPPVVLAMNATWVHSLRHAMSALVRIGSAPVRTAGKEGQAFSVQAGIRAGVTKKARSVVALSRVPR